MQEIDQSAFDRLLERIREQEHHNFGSLNWNGKERRFAFTIRFDRNGAQEDDDAIRARALRFLQALTPEEREAANIDVTLRNGVPVRAVLEGTTKELNPSRLRELEEQLFTQK